MHFVPYLHWKPLNKIALAELNSCGIRGNYSLKQAKLSKTSNERIDFPHNIRSGLKSWEGSLKLHAFVCFDQNWQSHPVFHQMLLLTDSLGLPQANPLHCVY